MQKKTSMSYKQNSLRKINTKAAYTMADLGGGRRGQGVRTPWDDLWFSNTTGILRKKKTMWFIGVEVQQETSAPPPKKNPESAPCYIQIAM